MKELLEFIRDDNNFWPTCFGAIALAFVIRFIWDILTDKH